jgi:hypothetical protein
MNLIRSAALVVTSTILCVSLSVNAAFIGVLPATPWR